MDSSEHVLQWAVDLFITEETLHFRFYIIIVALCATVYFILFNLTLI